MANEVARRGQPGRGACYTAGTSLVSGHVSPHGVILSTRHHTASGASSRYTKPGRARRVGRIEPNFAGYSANWVGKTKLLDEARMPWATNVRTQAGGVMLNWFSDGLAFFEVDCKDSQVILRVS